MWDRALRKMSTCDLDDQENGGKNTSYLIVPDKISDKVSGISFDILAYHLTIYLWHAYSAILSDFLSGK
jgi:hypothetical protein